MRSVIMHARNTHTHKRSHTRTLANRQAYIRNKRSKPIECSMGGMLDGMSDGMFYGMFDGVFDGVFDGMWPYIMNQRSKPSLSRENVR